MTSRSGGRTPGSKNKVSFMAAADMDRLAINPIEMLNEVYKLSIEAFKAHRGHTDKGDAGSHYLAVAGKAAIDLAKFKHPTLTAVAIKDLTDDSMSKTPLTTAQAIDIIKMDPFAPKEIKEIPTDRIVDAVNST